MKFGHGRSRALQWLFMCGASVLASRDPVGGKSHHGGIASLDSWVLTEPWHPVSARLAGSFAPAAGWFDA